MPVRILGKVRRIHEAKEDRKPQNGFGSLASKPSIGVADRNAMDSESVGGGRMNRLWLALLVIAAGVASGTTSAAAQVEEDGAREFTVRVAVEEVRLDAVVLDKKGRPVTDLTAADFEVYQDSRRQEVTSAFYVSNQAAPEAAPALPGRRPRSVAPLPAPAPERETVNRTLLFVVDDLSMDFQQIHFARMTLTNFVEKQMQPGDLVAILRTGYGNSALQMFLADRRQLLARIEKVRWGPNAGRDLEFDRAHYNLYHLFDGQLSTLRYGLRALKDMPGRKGLILLTAQPTISKRIYRSVDEMFAGKDIDYYYMFQKAYNRLADEALRSGAVVHVMDIRGLEAPAMERRGEGDWAPYGALDDRMTDGLNPLYLKTGGSFVQNSNFFVEGIGEEVENMLQGYYLLSYAPPETTFKENRKDIYHRVLIKVKRKGATVHTRDGFYGRATEEEAPPGRHPLQDAVFSPFLYRDLDVNLAAGYIDGAGVGYVLRSWIHLDARNLTLRPKPGEGHFAEVETVILTSDIDGGVHDSRLLRYLFRIPEENVGWVREHGIRFSLLLPVGKPGAYYVRAAVRDIDSGRVGSAYQFIEIPDLTKDRLALSNIFVLGRAEDAEWVRSGTARELSGTTFAPVLGREDGRSPALRQYVAGDRFSHMVVLYNARARKEEPPDLELQSVLYRDGVEVFRSGFRPLEIEGVKDFARIPVTQKLTLGHNLAEGDYVLELTARDKRRKEKDGLVSQALDFRITAPEASPSGR
jgi:VWFA-related protein